MIAALSGKSLSPSMGDVDIIDGGVLSIFVPVVKFEEKSLSNPNSFLIEIV